MENKTIKLTNEDSARLECFVRYYRIHGVENIQTKRPGFIVEDLEAILKILENALEV